MIVAISVDVMTMVMIMIATVILFLLPLLDREYKMIYDWMISIVIEFVIVVAPSMKSVAKILMWWSLAVGLDDWIFWMPNELYWSWLRLIITRGLSVCGCNIIAILLTHVGRFVCVCQNHGSSIRHVVSLLLHLLISLIHVVRMLSKRHEFVPRSLPETWTFGGKF